MKVLVTGASGFLGSHLARRLLAAGHRVAALARPGALLPGGLERMEGDLRDEASLTRASEGCEAVFHAAAVLGYRDSLDRLQEEVNVLGTRRLCAAARRAGVRRLILTSSVVAIGIPEEGELADESSPFGPQPARLPYARTKHAAELEVLEAVESGLDAVTVNPGVIFGVRPNRHHTLNLFETLAAGRMPVYPTGGVSWVWVEDVVDGCLKALEKGRTGSRYLLAGENLPYRDFMRAVCRAAGSRAPVLPLPGHALLAATALLGNLSPLSVEAARLGSRHLYYRSDLAARELGWHPTPLAEAIRHSIQTWMERKGAS